MAWYRAEAPLQAGRHWDGWVDRWWCQCVDRGLPTQVHCEVQERDEVQAALDEQRNAEIEAARARAGPRGSLLELAGELEKVEEAIENRRDQLRARYGAPGFVLKLVRGERDPAAGEVTVRKVIDRPIDADAAAAAYLRAVREHDASALPSAPWYAEEGEDGGLHEGWLRRIVHESGSSLVRRRAAAQIGNTPPPLPAGETPMLTMSVDTLQELLRGAERLVAELRNEPSRRVDWLAPRWWYLFPQEIEHVLETGTQVRTVARQLLLLRLGYSPVHIPDWRHAQSALRMRLSRHT